MTFHQALARSVGRPAAPRIGAATTHLRAEPAGLEPPTSRVHALQAAVSAQRPGGR